MYMLGKRANPLQLLAMALVIITLLLGGFTPRSTQASQVASGSSKKTGVTGDSGAIQGQVDADLRHVSGNVAVMIELRQPAAAASYAALNRTGASKTPSTAAVQAGRDQATRNDQAQQGILAALSAAKIPATTIFRVSLAYNGIAVNVDASKLEALAALPGVKAIHTLAQYTPSNASSVPLIGAPAAWTDYGFTGTGMRVGIIDTGIDYRHTNFGGPGTYTGCNPAVLTDTGCPFPTSKVVGGTDLAGDSYNAAGTGAALTPVPDPDPLDCFPANGGEGHGSHVAGSAAGTGVNADGSSYSGPYNTSTPFSSLKIGPGVAPQASLYAIKVFGCTGSTSLTTQAINWSLDPNGDSDMSDHLDVINMSLGSDFSGAFGTDAAASDNAALVGTVVVAAAGNANDLFYVSGSPADATRAISVAASEDAGAVEDGFRVNSPAAIAGVYPASESVAYNWASPPVTHTVPITSNLYYPATNQYGCTAWTSAEIAKISGNILLIDWLKPGDTTSPCGSAVRVTNAVAANAAGVIMVDITNDFSTAITGGAGTPAVITTKTVGDALKTQLTAGTVSSVSVTLSHEYHATTKVNDPSIVDNIAPFSSRGPRLPDSQLKPDISAPGMTIFSTAAGTGNGGASFNGTSMATPHMAGVMALLKQSHPSWTVEELKALVMNNAIHDIYSGLNQTGYKMSPQRQGAGRVDVPAALGGTVLAYGADIPGAVSVSFGAVSVVTTGTFTRTVNVVNKGASSATYTLGYDERSAIPGVTYTFPDGPTVTVGGGSTAQFTVQLNIDASLMKNTHDPTILTLQSGVPRQFISEASGNITLTPASGTALRVPVYVTARPASAMAATSSTLPITNITQTTSISLSGIGINEGTNVPTDTISIVTPYELAGTDPVDTVTDPRASEADIRAVGVTTDRAARASVPTSVVYFGIATQGQWAMPSAEEVEFDIYIDRDRNGSYDYVIYNYRVAATDTLYTVVYNLSTGVATNNQYLNYYSPSSFPSALYNNSVIVMPVLASAIGLTAGSNKFNYYINSYSQFQSTRVDIVGPYTYSVSTPGIDFTGGYTGLPYWDDLPGSTIPVTYNHANYVGNNSQGILLLHHFNQAATRYEVVNVAYSGATLTPTITSTSTQTRTPTRTATATNTSVSTATSTATAIPTNTATAIPATDTATTTATAIPATDTATAIPTDTSTAVPTDTATAVPTETATAVPTDTATATNTATTVPTDTSTATATGTATNSATATGTSTAVGTATNTPIPSQPVTWIDQVKVTASGNTITKSSATGAWDAGAASSMQIASGAGYVEATVADTTNYVMFGLSNGDTNPNYTDIDFGMYTYASTNELAVYEQGVYKTSTSGYTTGDVLRVAISGGVVKYSKNGVVFYTSASTAFYPLLLDASIYSPGGKVQNAIIAGGTLTAVTPWTPTASPTATNTAVPVASATVTWIHQVKVTAAANTITKSAATEAWDAGAASSVQIASGDGYVEATVADTNSYVMFGLSNGDTDAGYADIDYAVYTYASINRLAVYEKGVYKTDVAGYVAGDVVRVAVVGGVVKYSKNGTVFYTSAAAPTYPLLLDSSIFTTGGKVQNAIIAGGTLTNVPTWTPTASPTATSTALPISCSPVTFTSGVNVTASGNTIAKTSGGEAWNAGAISSKSITSGDGYVEQTVADAVSYTMFGLGTGNNAGNYTSIRYAIYTYASIGQLAIYENGAYKGTGPSYTTGDVVRVAVVGGAVKYSKNGTVFYTSSLVPSYPLVLNAAIFTTGGQISNAQICGYALTGASAPEDVTSGKLPASPKVPGTVPSQPVVGSSSVVAPATVPSQPIFPSGALSPDVPALPVVPQAATGFTDIAADFWAAPAIRWAAANLSLSGYDVAGGREFRPYQSATRGQVVKLLVVAAGYEVTSRGVQSFSDVETSNPFYSYIETAVAHNLITGYADGTFRPNTTLTRAQMAKLVAIASGWTLSTPDGTLFTDVPASDWAASYIATVAAHGVVTGYADGTFRPNAQLTRAQMVKVLYNTFAQQ